MKGKRNDEAIGMRRRQRTERHVEQIMATTARIWLGDEMISDGVAHPIDVLEALAAELGYELDRDRLNDLRAQRNERG